MTFRARVQASVCLHPVPSEWARPVSVCTCAHPASARGQERAEWLLCLQVRFWPHSPSWLPQSASRTWLMGIDLEPFKPSSKIRERRARELVPSGQEKNDEREMGNK